MPSKLASCRVLPAYLLEKQPNSDKKQALICMPHNNLRERLIPEGAGIKSSAGS
jgi:hypothetical protein